MLWWFGKWVWRLVAALTIAFTKKGTISEPKAKSRFKTTVA
jgi:hypothetical protein